MSYTKKLLVSSALAFAGFSQMAIGSQTLTETLAPQDHIKFAQQQETSHLPKLENAQSFPKPPATQPLSAWGVFSSFVTSFFEPFIQDAPKVLEALKEQKEELAKQGIQEYASNAMTKAGEFVIENPLDTVMLVGSAAMGWNVADTTFVPLAVYSASGLKNSQTIWSLANSIGKDKELLRLGVYGLALAYAATTLFPAVDAALPPMVGPQFRINQIPVRGGSSSIASLRDGNFVVAWTHPYTNITGRIFFPNGTGVTDEFLIGNDVYGSNSPGVVSVAGLTDGNFFVAWLSESLNITGRTYYPSGAPFTNPYPIAANQDTTYYRTGYLSEAAALKNGNVFVSWSYYAFSPPCGEGPIFGRILSPTGSPITAQFQLNQEGLPIQTGYPIALGLADGNALTAWGEAFGNYVGRIVFPNGALGDEFIINEAQFGDPCGSSEPAVIAGAGLVDGSALLAYQNTTSFGSSLKNIQVLGRIIKNGLPLGDEFSVENNEALVSSVAALTDGNALVTYDKFKMVRPGQPDLGFNLTGVLYDSSGTALTNPFTIVSYHGYSSTSAGLANRGVIVDYPSSDSLYGASVSLAPTSTQEQAHPRPPLLVGN